MIEEIRRKIIKEADVDKDWWPKQRKDAISYFQLDPEALAEIMKMSREIKKVEGEVVHIDIGGNAKFSRDAHISDITESFALSNYNSEIKNTNFFKGDFFNNQDFDFFVSKIKNKYGKVNLVTMETLGGLYPYDPILLNRRYGIDIKKVERFLLRVFLRRIRSLSEIITKGGFIYFGVNAFVNSFITQNFNFIENYLKKLDFEIIYSRNRSEIGNLLIRKAN